MNKFESYTLQVENKFAKLKADVKKAIKLSERVNMMGPSGGIYIAHGSGNQGGLDVD